MSLQEKFCEGCPTPGGGCPCPGGPEKGWKRCNWKATYQETGIWGMSPEEAVTIARGGIPKWVEEHQPR